MLYVILDEVVDGYGPLASAYDERLVALENDVLDRHPRGRAHVLHEVLAFKRDLVRLRHAAAPCDILAPLPTSLRPPRRRSSGVRGDQS